MVRKICFKYVFSQYNSERLLAILNINHKNTCGSPQLQCQENIQQFMEFGIFLTIFRPKVLFRFTRMLFIQQVASLSACNQVRKQFKKNGLKWFFVHQFQTENLYFEWFLLAILNISLDTSGSPQCQENVQQFIAFF